MGAAAAIAVMRMKEREVREDFLRAGATMPINAMSLADVGIGESMAVRRLIKRAVIREASPGMFYFDEEVWLSVRAMRRRMAMVMLVILIAFAILATFGVRTFK
ncbi:MAG TPA: hypothetical protein VM053_07895 [Gemmatimonadaceae bacterium]|nr:hypothetical protein [Gemmatimonadaceae bacterium]